MAARADQKAQAVPMPGPAVRGAMAVGGALWALFGYYRFMTPHGNDVLWREDLGYSLILSNGLFILYNLPGVVALLATTWAALSYVVALHPMHRRLRIASVLLLMFAAVFGLMAAAGQLGQFDALTTGGLSFGVLFLGLALFTAGLAMTKGKDSTGRNRPMVASGLMLLGGIGVMTLLLRPLMYALQLLPLAFGAAACMLFGLAWIGFGLATGIGTKNQ